MTSVFSVAGGMYKIKEIACKLTITNFDIMVKFARKPESLERRRDVVKPGKASPLVITELISLTSLSSSSSSSSSSSVSLGSVAEAAAVGP